MPDDADRKAAAETASSRKPQQPKRPLIASEGADKYNEYFAKDNDPTRKRGRAADLGWIEKRTALLPSISS